MDFDDELSHIIWYYILFIDKNKDFDDECDTYEQHIILSMNKI